MTAATMKRDTMPTDEEIRQILRERKKLQRRHEKLHAIKEAAEGIIGFASLMFICFMLTVMFG